MDTKEYFFLALDRIKQEGRYRVFTELDGSVGGKVYSYSVNNAKNVTIWCSNDYLSMSKNPVVIDELSRVARQCGVGSGGTRNISGTSNAIAELEREISNLHNKESALVFTSGYIANQATLSSISQIIPECVIFSDQDNHASIIHGIKESKLQKAIFKHNDIKDLECKLQSYPLERPKLIVFESVYSMSGDIAPVSDICRLAKKYNAITYVDEVHSVGIYGNQGSGMCEELGFQDEIDIIQGTFGKAYGVIGGYIASRYEIVDSIRSCSPGFIFTTALPPAIARAILSSVRYLRKSNKERIKLKSIVTKLKIKLKEKKIEFLKNNTHIVPVMINDALLCQQVYKELLNDYGIYIQGINFPTVPKGKERLRITLNPHHTEQMIDYFVDSLYKVLKKFNINNITCKKKVLVVA